MFLDAITILRTQPCLADPGKLMVIGKPSRSLEEVIPYLATLPGVIAYNPGTYTLTFRRPAGFLTIAPDSVYLTQVRNVEEGLELTQAVKDAINATWEHRHELQPVTVAQRAPRHLDVYALLPQSNCRQCGEDSCLAFAVKMILQERVLAECAPLKNDEAFADRKVTLEAMV